MAWRVVVSNESHCALVSDSGAMLIWHYMPGLMDWSRICAYIRRYRITAQDIEDVERLVLSHWLERPLRLCAYVDPEAGHGFLDAGWRVVGFREGNQSVIFAKDVV